MSKQVDIGQATTSFWPIDFAREAWAYGLDALQRGILFADVIRERGKRYEEHAVRGPSRP